MRRNRTVSERLLAAALCLLMLVSLMPAGEFSVRAEDTGSEVTYGPCGTVSVLDDALTVDETDQTYITVTNSSVMTLQFVEDDGTRGSDGWWVGVKVSAPSDVTEEQLQSATLTSGGSVLPFWSNKDSQEGDAVHYIWMYGLITQAYIENDDDGLVNYTWTFDWDATSETASQTVKLSINTANLILMNGEDRVYPSVYATLSSTYGGTVEVDGDGNATLTVSGVTVPLDTETMKWYIDVTVTLPDGATDAMEGNNAFTSPTTYHLELEPDGDSYTVSGSLSGEFSWKIGSQVVKQTLSIVAEDVTLLKADQAALTFEKTENPVEKKVNDGSYTNRASGGSVDGNVTYSSSNTDVATVNRNGKVTFKNAGETVITATKAGNEYYNDVSTSYTLVLTNADWDLNWETPNPEALSFQDGLTYQNKAFYSNGGQTTSEGITYASNNENIATVDANGVVTVKSVGEVTISATKSGASGMNERTIYYTLTIVKGDQTVVIDGADTILCDPNGEETFSYAISGITGTGETTVATSDETVATVELQEIDGKLTAVVTPLKAGTFTLTVRNAGDDNYNAAENTKEITILYAETNASFEKGNEATVTYNDNGNQYSNLLIVSGTGAITYSSDNETIATVNAEGVVTINQHGTVVITASKAADAEYGPVELSYTLTINPADQKIELNPASATVSNGETDYTIALTETEGWVSTGAYSFVIAEKEETLLGTTVDGTGKITIAQGAYGTMTVKVTRAADACFNEWSGTFTLTVTQLAVENGNFSLSGTYNSDTGWYNSKVTVTYTDGLLAKHSDNDEFAGSYVLSDGIYTADENAVILCVQDQNSGAIAHNVNVNEILGNICVDTNAPTNLKIEYSNDVAGQVLETLTFGYYKAKMTVTISATDRLSGVWKYSYSLDGTNYTEKEANDDGKLVIEIDPQYKGQISFSVMDYAGNESNFYSDDVIVVVDDINPKIAVEWNEANSIVGTTRYYDGDAEATITITEANFHAEDVIIDGGVFGEAWTEVAENTWQNIVTLSDEGNHVLTITYKDRSTNLLTGDNTQEGVYTSETIVIDNIAPKVSVSIDTQGKRQYFNKDQVVTITVEEKNFDPGLVEIQTLSDIGISAGQWKHNGDTHTLDLTFFGDAKYTLKVKVTDLADHEVSTDAQYFTVDQTAPSDLKVTYSNDVAGQVLEALTFGYYKAKMTVTISAADATSGVATIYYKLVGDKAYTAAEAKTGEYTFSIDPQYKGNVQFYVVDVAGNKSEVYSGQLTAVVDNINPEISVEWNAATNEVNGTRYYAGAAVATITITEANFYAEDVKIEGGTFDGAWTAGKGNTWQNTVTLSDEGKHVLTISYKDRSTNPMTGDNTKNGVYTSETVVVDNTAPSVPVITYSTSFADKVLETITFHYYHAPVTVTITSTDATAGVQSFSYEYVLNSNVSAVNNGGEGTLKATKEGNVYTASFIIPEASLDSENQFNGYVIATACDLASNTSTTKDKDDTLIVDNIAPVGSVEWNAATNEVNGICYYDSKAVATVTITEANFYAGSDVVVTGGTLDGAWTSVGADTWQNTVTLDDEGDYVLGISYTDRSGNEMKSYTSGTVIVDHTNPVITASISNGANRQYYNETQTVTVTVVEKNFDSSLVNLSAGADAGVTYGEWKHDGDTHTITITFAGDANYALNADVTDLVGRTAALTEQQITVDKTAPSVNIEYSVRAADRILSGITFYYYRAPVTVTITATDPTAGITGFDYVYTLAQGVSSVNNGGTGSVEARWDTTRNAYVASFQVPGQFSGNITVTTTDRAGNTTTDSNGIGAVVDTINPTATVTFNDPYQILDDVSYYAGDIEATISITEANFDASDVVVSVMKDGQAYDVDVNWVNNSVDSHTGRFTLTEDGDYTLSVSYKDISGNEMVTYVSEQLTLDAQGPVIRVSDIVADSANKADPYGFVITITDTNLDVESMKPVLQAVMQNEDGLYVTQTIELGEPVEVTAGQEYTYTVENLDQDALYTLTCEATDMAGNLTNTVVLDDGQSYDEVQFSINRSGSTFGFGDKYTEELIGQYYVYEVYEDVVIVEVNVDPIENYVVMLNGVQLDEDVDYTTEQTSESGAWSKRTYIIHKELFAEEGEYSIVINSKDKTETNAYSDVKNLFVAYVVDKTAPVLTISGLEEGGRYQTNEQSVTIIPTDEGGCLNSLTVLVLDANGDPLTDDSGNDISVRFDMSGEEFLTYLEENNGMVTFTVPSGLNVQVQIICTDCALKDDGTTNEYNETFSKVTVSSNQLVIFYANTPLFIGTIAGGLALILFIILLLKRKKDKKNGK